MNKKILIFINIVFILIFLPYVTFFKFSSDIQPWSVLFCSILTMILFYKDDYLVKSNYFKIILIVLFSSIFSFSLLLILNLSDISVGVKSIIGYLSIAVFSYIGYKTFRYLDYKYFFITVFLWLTFLIIQIFFGLEILSPLLSRISGGGIRGFTSLSPEPAMYAFIGASLLVLNEFLFYTKKSNEIYYFLTFLLIIIQIILSYSGMGVLILILFAFSKLIEIFFIKENKKTKNLSIFIFLLVALSIYLFSSNSFLGNTRGGNVFTNFVKEPISLVINDNENNKDISVIKNDLSFSYRMANPILGLYGGMIKTYGLGFGIGLKERENVPIWLSEIIGVQKRFGGRIEGGLVQTIYELGFIGIIFNLTILFLIVESILKNKDIKPVLLSSLIIIFSLTFCFGSIAFPPIGYIIGLHIYFINKNL